LATVNEFNGDFATTDRISDFMPVPRSVLSRLSIAIALLYLLGTVFGGLGLGWIALHPSSPAVSQSEQDNARAAANGIP